MNVLYISAARIPSRAANSIHVMKMCQAFATLGIKTYLVSAKKSDELESGVENIFTYYGVTPNFSLVRLPWVSIPGFALLYSIQVVAVFLWISLTQRQRPLCFSRFPMGLYLVKLFRPEMILEIHAPIPERGVQAFMMKRIVADAKLRSLIVISDALKKIVLEDFPELEDKIIVAHDAADLVTSDTQFPLVKHTQTKLHLGYVGHLYKGRGVDTMIQIAKELPHAHIHLAGGLEEDIAYWKEQTTKINNITFYGFLPPTETVAFRESVDVLLAPYEKKVSVYNSKMDTSRWMSPLKLFEYMSAKKPIICSDIPVLREVLTDRHNALLCNPDHPEEWVSAVKTLITHKDVAEHIASVAYDDFIKKYTWRGRAQRVINRYLVSTDNVQQQA